MRHIFTIAMHTIAACYVSYYIILNFILDYYQIHPLNNNIQNIEDIIDT